MKLVALYTKKCIVGGPWLLLQATMNLVNKSPPSHDGVNIQYNDQITSLACFISANWIKREKEKQAQRQLTGNEKKIPLKANCMAVKSLLQVKGQQGV